MLMTPQNQVPHGRAFKYQFDLEIHKVSMHIPIRCFVELSWRRGNKSIQTKNKIEIQGHEVQFNVGQKLSMISTCYFDETSRKFTEKNSNINLVLYINNIPKAGGSCPVDLSQILNPLNYKECYSKTIDASLIKCPISLTGKISFSLVGIYLQEMLSGDDNRSIGSGVSGISSSVLNYSDSNFCLYFNKKNTVSDVPSKDLFSNQRNDKNIENSRNSSKKSDDGFRETKRKIQCISQYSQQNNNTVTLMPITVIASNLNPLNIINQNSQGQNSNLTISSKINSVSKKKSEKIEQNYYQIKKENGTFGHTNQANKQKASLKELKDEKLREEKFRLDNQNTQLRVYVQEQTKKINQFIKQNLGLKEQYKILFERHEKCDKIQKESENQILKYQDQIKQLQINLTQIKQKKIQIQTQLSTCQNQLADTKKLLQNMQQNTNTEYQLKISQLQNLITKQMKEIEIKIIEKDKFETLKMEFDNVKNKFQRSELERNRIIQHYQREAYAYNAKFNQFNSNYLNKLTEKQNFIETIKREFQKTYNQKQDLVKIRDDLNLQINQLQSNLQQINFENQRLVQTLQTNQNNQKYEEKLKTMINQYKVLEKALVNNNQKMKLKEKEIFDKEESIRSKDQILRLKTIENQELQKKIVVCSSVCRKWEDQIRLKTEEAKQASQLISQLKNQVDVLNQSNANQRKQGEIYLGKIQKLLKQFNLKQNQIAKLSDDLKEFAIKSAKLRSECQNYKGLLQQKQIQFQNQIKDAKQNLKNQSNNVFVLTEENTSFKLKIENFYSRNKQLEDKCLQFQRTIIEYENILKQQSQELSLLNQIIQKHQQDKNSSKNQQDGTQQLLKQNIRLQIQLKVASEELKMQSSNAEQLMNVKNKLYIQQQNIKQYEQQIQKLERELKQKYRAIILETQKNKMYCQEKNSFIQSVNQKTYQYELQKEKSEILQKNIKQVQARLQEEIKKSKDLEANIRSLTNDLHRKQEKTQEVKILEKRTKELENRESEKILILEQLNKNLYKSNEVIKQLHKTIEVKNKDIINREKIINQLQNRLNNNQELKKKSVELLGALNEKKNIEKKNELLFNEICLLRQRCDENAKNSTHAVNNQQLIQKIHQLENQLSKREDKLKKLEKQNNKLEQENIQLNIKIMKELTQIQKKQQGIKIQYSKSLNKVLSDSQF